MNNFIAFICAIAIIGTIGWCYITGINKIYNMERELPPREITPRAYSLEGSYNYRVVCWRCHIKYDLQRQGLWPEIIYKEDSIDKEN